jgi:WD40 repeat protein
VTEDGQRAVSASEDKTLKVWDLKTGWALLTLEGHFGHIYGVGVSRDGRRAVFASDGGTVEVWDLDMGRVLRTLEGHDEAIYRVSMSADGLHAVAWVGELLRVWEVETGALIATFTCDEWLESCAFEGKSKILPGDVNGRICLLKLEE